MSKQLKIASALSIAAFAAVALFAPSIGAQNATGATSELAAPALSAELPLAD